MVKLDEHLRLHDNNLITCAYCQWKGKTKWDLFDHMNHHFQIRTFKCSFCDVTSYRACNRNRHEKDFHEKILDRYKCDKCPFISHSVNYLNNHKRKEH